MNLDLFNGSNEDFISWITSLSTSSGIESNLSHLNLSEEDKVIIKRAVAFFSDYYIASSQELRSLGRVELHETSTDIDKDINTEIKTAIKSIKLDFKKYINDEELDRDTYKYKLIEFFKENNVFYEPLIGALPDEDIDAFYEGVSEIIINDSFKDTLENIKYADFLVRVNRQFNLDAKLAHTARMLYMTVDSLFKDGNNIDLRIKELGMLSVLFHDIGRFYQAVHYPDFFDSKVKAFETNQSEDESDLSARQYSDLKSHGQVGYFFCLQSLITQDIIKCDDIENMDRSLLLYSLMSVATKIHQAPNNKIPWYDLDYENTEFDFEKLSRIVKLIYKYADPIVISPYFDLDGNIRTVAEFHENEAGYIIKCINLLHKNNQLPDNQRESVNSIKDYLKSFYKEDRLNELIDNPELLKEDSLLKSILGVEEIDEELFLRIEQDDRKLTDDSIRARFELLNGYLTEKNFADALDYLLRTHYELSSRGLEPNAQNINMVIDGINDEIKDDKQEVSDRVRELIVAVESTPELRSDVDSLERVMSAGITITTDMDKLDIFNQRINDSWEKTNATRMDKDIRKEHVEKMRDALFTGSGVFGESSHEAIPRNYDNEVSQLAVLWWHMDQFITVNLRNYSSFKFIKDSGQISYTVHSFVDYQKQEIGKSIEDTAMEIGAFTEMFVDMALNSRIDENGNLLLPVMNENSNGTYEFVPQETGVKPTIFKKEQIDEIRKQTCLSFIDHYNYEVVDGSIKVGDTKPRMQDDKYLDKQNSNKI